MEKNSVFYYKMAYKGEFNDVDKQINYCVNYYSFVEPVCMTSTVHDAIVLNHSYTQVQRNDKGSDK
mgnify:CR=1 FL=1